MDERVLLRVIFVASLLLAGCAVSQTRSADANYVTSYYDRNHDGIVDVEYHHHRYATDSDWALIDTHFLGHFDTKALLLVYRRDMAVLPIPLPQNVSITTGQPPLSISSDQPELG